MEITAVKFRKDGFYTQPFAVTPTKLVGILPKKTLNTKGGFSYE